MKNIFDSPTPGKKEKDKIFKIIELDFFYDDKDGRRKIPLADS